MASIATSSDGNYIFAALEDGSNNQIISKSSRSDLSTWSVAYNPGAGSASNVIPVPSDPDKMLFYGNFGTNVVLILHTISTGTNTDISPSSLGAKVINTCEVNPQDASQIVITVDTDQDMLYTSDQGSNWTAWSSALGLDATATELLWSGAYWPHRVFVAGDNGANLDLLYSPNQMSQSGDEASGSLASAADICSVEVSQ